MATPSNTPLQLSGLARRLVKDGCLSLDKAQEALRNAQNDKIPFVSFLVQKQIVNDRVIAEAASDEFGVPLLDLDAMDKESLALSAVADTLVKKHSAIPLFKRGSRLFVGLSDPTNFQALDEFKFHTGVATEPVIVEERKLQAILESTSEDPKAAFAELGDSDLDGLEITGGDDLPKVSDDDSDVDDTPIVRFINKVLLDAINRKASDIHFEPYEKVYRVRFRQDGILSEVISPPVTLATKIAARLKVMARLDISEKRVPQDGRIKMVLSKNRAIDFRVNSCPTLFGEKIVMRILDPSSAKLGIELLGYEPDQQKLFLNALHRPNGMVLVTGPTGSGKTVSLYTGLNILNTEDRNISTAEDPAEINLPGINQVNVNPKVGLTFAAALRAFLRQDPDVIMVGEIRDLETAEIAIKAAQTGHMVLSTLHTNDAPQTLTRLLNMGVAPFNIASAVNLIIAQRLCRRLCDHCKQRMDLPEDALRKEGFTESDIPGIAVYGPTGCEKCNAGYKGRVGIYQVMPITEEVGRLIMSGGNSMEVADLVHKQGVRTLKESGLLKVKAGVTSLEEIHRVITD